LHNALRYEVEKSRELKFPNSTNLSRRQTHGQVPMQFVESTQAHAFIHIVVVRFDHPRVEIS